MGERRYWRFDRTPNLRQQVRRRDTQNSKLGSPIKNHGNGLNPSLAVSVSEGKWQQLGRSYLFQTRIRDQTYDFKKTVNGYVFKITRHLNVINRAAAAVESMDWV